MTPEEVAMVIVPDEGKLYDDPMSRAVMRREIKRAILEAVKEEREACTRIAEEREARTRIAGGYASHEIRMRCEK